MEKGQALGTNMVFICYLLLKEANIHINLICFDHPHINVVVTFVPRKQPKKPHFFHKNSFLLKKIFDMYHTTTYITYPPLAGRGNPTTSTMVGPKILQFMFEALHFESSGWTNNCQIEVFPNGQTNLALLSPPLC